MTETPSGRDGTSAADRAAARPDGAPSAHTAHEPVRRPVRRRPPPLHPQRGLPADTLALLVLLVVIILVLSLGAFISR